MIGAFNERVTIQKPRTDATADAAGHVDLTDETNWEQHCVRHARFLSHAGREFFNAKQTQADLSEIVEVFYDGDTRTITPKMRLKMRETRYLNIAAAYNVEERNKTVRIHCTEAV